jgi:hypothetical protein
LMTLIDLIKSVASCSTYSVISTRLNSHGFGISVFFTSKRHPRPDIQVIKSFGGLAKFPETPPQQ